MSTFHWSTDASFNFSSWWLIEEAHICTTQSSAMGNLKMKRLWFIISGIWLMAFGNVLDAAKAQLSLLIPPRPLWSSRCEKMFQFLKRYLTKGSVHLKLDKCFALGAHNQWVLPVPCLVNLLQSQERSSFIFSFVNAKARNRLCQ